MQPASAPSDRGTPAEPVRAARDSAAPGPAGVAQTTLASEPAAIRPAPAATPNRAAITSRLRAAGCVYAEDEAALLAADARDPADLERMLAARIAGTPIELVLGWAEFHGLRIAVEAGVFVPRRRTGLLVDTAVTLAAPGAVVVDLCCGTGAIGAAIAARRPDLEVWASDVDPDAVRCARRNIHPDHVVEGDLFDALPKELRGRIGAVVANAPYVPTGEIALMPREARDWEHAVALDGGDDGLAVQRRVAAQSREWLAPGAVVIVETSERQAPLSAALLAAAGLRAAVASAPDIDATAVIGRRAG
ncbi:putative protein N(5)-glutamine methyltransferase [Marisediminicola senii]|uniref:putative protein N(5)-glutamine methyltransferase n=1 Tax=Marisediminicola senii TaxID=2711233 RepID=UPI0013ED5FBC|nr:putative protein N(5)-glutamine methyltransferase [Marisediminicola senii]